MKKVIALRMLLKNASKRVRMFLFIGAAAIFVVVTILCFFIEPTEPEYKKYLQKNFFATEQSYEEETTVKKYLLSLPNEPTQLGDAGVFLGDVDSQQMKDIWNGFADRVNSGKKAEITLAKYTDEGDMLYDYLYYDGNKFYYMRDTSRDHFGDRIVSELRCGTYFVSEDYEDKENSREMKHFLLSEDKEMTPSELVRRILSSDSSKVNRIDYDKMIYLDSFQQFGGYKDIVIN